MGVGTKLLNTIFMSLAPMVMHNITARAHKTIVPLKQKLRAKKAKNSVA
jgi:hypothetical protein